MNYYIQGNKERADEIKAAFEKLGYDISWPEGFANPDVINIGVERNGAKYVIAETSEYIKDIIKTHPDYTELELPVEPKFKVEDWIISEHPDAIFKVGDVKKTTYQLIDIYGDSYDCQITEIEKNYHLWTIQDAKDGDVLVTTKIRSCPFIYRKTNYNNNLAYYYAGIDGNGDFSEGCLKGTLYHFGLVSDVIPATKEQRDLLFAKMKEAGYEWDANKKKLRKIKPHYDISNFNPFDKVLVRQDDSCTWGVSFFGRYAGMFMCCSNVCFAQCIPFEGNEHLLGTTEPCDEQYINW